MSPKEISDEIMALSARYYTGAEAMGAIAERKAVEWLLLKNKPRNGKKGIEYPTNAEVDKIWDATADGKEEARLTWHLRGIDKRMSALKTKLRVMEGESRNHY